MKKKIFGLCHLLFFVVLLILAGCTTEQQEPETECPQRPSQDTIDSLQQFENTYISILKEYVESQDQLTNQQIRTLESLEKLDDHPLYTMHHYGDYQLDEFIKTGITSANQLQREFPGCTCFSALNQDGDIIFGRNFDYEPMPLLLLFTHPKKGYASISMVPIPLGFSIHNLHQAAIEDKKSLLYTPYFTVDGMNEKGFAVAEMEISGESVFDEEKISLISLQIQRLLLDKAKNIEEAIQLLQTYNNLDSHRIHYLISDASGQSAIVEYYNGSLLVSRSGSSWQVSTNFLVLNRPADQLTALCDRYNFAHHYLMNRNGLLTQHEAMTLLADVSVSCRTQHSVVYNLSNKTVSLSLSRNYNNIFYFSIKK